MESRYMKQFDFTFRKLDSSLNIFTCIFNIATFRINLEEYMFHKVA